MKKLKVTESKDGVMEVSLFVKIPERVLTKVRVHSALTNTSIRAIVAEKLDEIELPTEMEEILKNP